MIKRYTLLEMGRVFSDENRFQKMLDIEILACEAWNKLGLIPNKDLITIKKKAKFNIPRIRQIEKRVEHETIAFLKNLEENIGPSSRYIHIGLTSSDILDTTQICIIKQACKILIKDLEKLSRVLKDKAKRYKFTPMIGRTHGIHAEPITFGLKMTLFYQDTELNILRLKQTAEDINTGKISGAVGTYSNIEPFVEEYVCKKLGLKVAIVSTQVIQRETFARFLTTLAIIGASLEKIAQEIRHLQRTEVGEVEEPFLKTQKGSSAMPHKRNPVICERICGLARILRSNAYSSLENIALWHERDISHSSVERVIVPDSCILLDYILNKTTFVLEELVVHPEIMKQNLDKTKGLIYSGGILNALAKKGMERDKAYNIVQKIAQEAKRKEKNFKVMIFEEKQIKKYLSKKEIKSLFDLNYYLRNIDKIYKRINL